ncbi:hypothetical protein FIM10_01875 [Sphingomonadales bacterium 56]|uniref:hypothetical protein n=1 Tax=unclassified Sphingobium TaxID=2611147 RepID=UPI00191AC7BB|nr:MULTISPECIES: hypothetical protein [unclassified Sphingobium]MBY2927432.1 hypothetical protein [Sphingomonadales bacterium 56]MBY2957500.1 hypothetical protein [Sphingomonadales bacterium 58]MBY2957543.1 hypothetical protein [Sphingomonadales bacterium 58]CAD7335179.1 hypothetical protein SPHS8_00377 [Sphingobium sp. S8]CAD7335198.1 hypothetical protein SPHS6_00377 [Sphingobium sp. S6]
MSTESGTGKVAADMLDEAKSLVEAAQAEEAQQLDLLGDVTPEDMVEAREALGQNAGKMAVLREARERKRGRPKNSRNKRTDDFARYLMQFGQHPAITMMQIQSTPQEVLIEASRQPKVHSFSKSGRANIVTERMTYAEATSLRIRCAEALMPYLESKKPVAVDMTFSGISDLIIEGVTHSSQEVSDIVDAEFISLPGLDGEDGE